MRAGGWIGALHSCQQGEHGLDAATYVLVASSMLHGVFCFDYRPTQGTTELLDKIIYRAVQPIRISSSLKQTAVLSFLQAHPGNHEAAG